MCVSRRGKCEADFLGFGRGDGFKRWELFPLHGCVRVLDFCVQILNKTVEIESENISVKTDNISKFLGTMKKFVRFPYLENSRIEKCLLVSFSICPQIQTPF